MKEVMPVQFARLDTERIKGYKELLDFYHGRQWEGRERRRERRLAFNYAKVFVDKITSYLMSGINFAVAHHGDYGWLSSPAGVWRAEMTAVSLDLSADITGLRQEQDVNSGGLTVELRNDDGRYAAPGQGDIAVLDLGCQLDISPGYVTPAGNEVSAGQSYSFESYEHTSAGGSASLILHARDGWGALGDWKARCQFRWNKASDEMSVRDIIAFVLARAGLQLEVVSSSSVITGFYPDFTINSGNSGGQVIRKLLSFVPDVLLLEGNKAYIINPLASDSSVYGYGGGHPVREGKYVQKAWELNRVQVEGYDSGAAAGIVVDNFNWNGIDRCYDRLAYIEDRNIGTAAEAQQRGQAYLREAEIASGGGAVLVPVNCGQQLYDVVDITDSRAGLDAARHRVVRLALVYDPRRGEYRQRLWLGRV
ncbi:hypothetical protein ACFLV2_00880 [Chloroflexota bacterium]